MTTMRSLRSVTALTGVLLLAGCSFSNAGYAVLNSAPTSADALPSNVVKNFAEIDSKTSRLAAEDGDVSFWIARGNQPGRICLVVFTNAEEWLSACGGSLVRVTGSSGPTYSVYPGGTPTPDGERKISENVFATTGE